MKIDHFIVNVDEKYQNDNNTIENIRKISHMSLSGEKELKDLKFRTFGLGMSISKFKMLSVDREN